MRRREFIAGLGSAAAWPLAAQAQRQSRMPLIGVLWINRNERFPLWAAFAPGLADAGFILGENVTMEIRAADLQNTRLPALADDLVQRQVDVIFAANSAAPVQIARSATTTIPIVFFYGGDPVKDGLVSSLARPGGNVTGVTGMQAAVWSKRLGLLHELVPGVTTIGYLTGPRLPLPENFVLTGARTLGLDVVIGRAGSSRDIEAAFAVFAERRIGALVVDSDVVLDDPKPIILLAERYKIPAFYPVSLFVQQGGLISYSSDVAASYRQAAAQYVGPILKGAKPAELPVQQPIKFELTINMKAAKAIGLTIPETLLATADKVIE
jgi:putative tryptophan/tyrosine transport system substrate-binding protein